MKIAIVHHAEKKTDIEDPSLTVFGIEQSKKAAQFVAQHLDIHKIFHTQTQRTRQSAEALQIIFPSAECISIAEAPQEWDAWCIFTENLYKQSPYPCALICHHTTLQMCKKQFQLSLSLSSHSSVIILERTQHKQWDLLEFRQGEISL